MDPIATSVAALAAGAAAGLQPVSQAAVKDAYDGFKALIKQQFSRVSVDLLDADPTSAMRQVLRH